METVVLITSHVMQLILNFYWLIGEEQEAKPDARVRFC